MRKTFDIPVRGLENFTTFVVYDWFEVKVTLPAGWLACSIQVGVDRCFDPQLSQTI
jgi:hypothetical protein